MAKPEMKGPFNPNILLILTDQHWLSALGCYGETPCRTPHIDRLAGHLRPGIRQKVERRRMTISTTNKTVSSQENDD